MPKRLPLDATTPWPWVPIGQLPAWPSTVVTSSELRPQDSNLDLTAPKAVVLPLHQGGTRAENAR